MGAIANAAILARDTDFRDRVLAAVCFYARQVMAEPQSTDNYIFRTTYARSVLGNPLAYIDSFAWTIAADPTIAILGSTANAVGEDVLMGRVAVAWNALITPPTRD